MELALSQLGFSTREDLLLLRSTLLQNGIDNLEIVLPKVSMWQNLNVDTLKTYIADLHNLGFSIKSTQSILYNTSVESLYQKEFLVHMQNLITLCSAVDINRIVLGAPKTRVAYNEDRLLEVFNILDRQLTEQNVALCIEPNCTKYGGYYFFTISEIVGFLKKGNYLNISTMIDTHNIVAENLDPISEYTTYRDFITHVHISEVDLKLFKSSLLHVGFSNCLRDTNYQGLITYEVASTRDSEGFIESLINFSNVYRK